MQNSHQLQQQQAEQQNFQQPQNVLQKNISRKVEGSYEATHPQIEQHLKEEDKHGKTLYNLQHQVGPHHDYDNIDETLPSGSHKCLEHFKLLCRPQYTHQQSQQHQQQKRQQNSEEQPLLNLQHQQNHKQHQQMPLQQLLSCKQEQKNLRPQQQQHHPQQQPQQPQQRHPQQQHPQPHPQNEIMPASVALSFDGEEGVHVYKNRLRIMNHQYQQDKESFQVPPNRTVMHDIPHSTTHDDTFTRNFTSTSNNNISNYKLFFDDDIDGFQKQQQQRHLLTQKQPLLRHQQKSLHYRSSSPGNQHDYVSCSLLSNWKKDKKLFAAMTPTASTATTTLVSTDTIPSSPQIKLTQLLSADSKQRSSSADSVKKLVAKLAQLRPGRRFCGKSSTTSTSYSNKNVDNNNIINNNNVTSIDNNNVNANINNTNKVTSSFSLASINKDQKLHHQLVQHQQHDHHLLHRDVHQPQVKLATLPTTTNQLKRYLESTKEKDNDDNDTINNTTQSSLTLSNNKVPWELPPNYVDMIFSKELEKNSHKTINSSKTEIPECAVDKAELGFSLPPTPTVALKSTK